MSNKEKLEAELNRLEAKAKAILPQEDCPRSGAINNIRQVISCAVTLLYIDDDGGDYAESAIKTSSEALQQLIDNPDFFGSHEFLKKKVDS